MTDGKIQDNTVMNDGHFFHYSSPSLCEIRNLSEMASNRSNDNEAFLLLSCLLIVASLVIACACKEIATQRHSDQIALN